LLEPARSVRLGARYLQHLVERFGGDTLLAVAAYNGGPGTIERWRAVRAWGDRALDCELIARPETEDYVKKVLSVRQAYRDLRPGFAAP
jgi:soluble lytic murein transglycosylase